MEEEFTLEKYIEDNYEIIRREYEKHLIEHWYNALFLSEINDWWEEFCLEYFNNQ